jgi:hypothetical protein
MARRAMSEMTLTFSAEQFQKVKDAAASRDIALTVFIRLILAGAMRRGMVDTLIHAAIESNPDMTIKASPKRDLRPFWELQQRGLWVWKADRRWLLRKRSAWNLGGDPEVHGWELMHTEFDAPGEGKLLAGKIGPAMRLATEILEQTSDDDTGEGR